MAETPKLNNRIHPDIRTLVSAPLFGLNQPGAVDLRGFEAGFFKHIIGRISESGADLVAQIAESALGHFSSSSNSKVDRAYRTAVAKRFGLAEETIIATSGTLGALDLILTVLASGGTGILVPKPHCPSYAQIASIRSGTVLFYDALIPDQAVRDIRAGLKKGASAIIVNQPNGPTGAVLSPGTLGSISALAKGHNAFAIWDKTYSWMLDNDDVFPTGDENIFIYGFEEWCGLPALRAGAVATSNEEVRDILAFVHASTSLGISPLDAIVAMAFLEIDSGAMIDMRNQTMAVLSQRRAALADRLSAMGYRDELLRKGTGFTFMLDTDNRYFPARNFVGVPGAYFGMSNQTCYCLGVSDTTWANALTKIGDERQGKGLDLDSAG